MDKKKVTVEKKSNCTRNIKKIKGAFFVKEINKCRLMLASTIAYTLVIPNYKMFWLFQIHRFCYALRYTLCLDT